MPTRPTGTVFPWLINSPSRSKPASSGYDVCQAYYRRCEEQAGISGWEPARRITYLRLHSPFVNYHLAADRLDMAHGVEVRLPFLDRQPDFDPAAHTAVDSLLLVLTSVCMLQERFRL